MLREQIKSQMRFGSWKTKAGAGLLLIVVLTLAVLGFTTATSLATDYILDRFYITEAGSPASYGHTVSQKTLKRREMVKAIYFLESTNGKFDPCVRDKQGFNGFGYAPGTCYESHKAVRALVEDWIKDKQDAGWSEAQMLCRYNLGGWHQNCKYYQDYLRIN